MFASSHKFKIFNSVVKSIAVLVVYNFALLERAVEMQFHDISVLKYICSIDANDFIAIFDPSSALGPEVMPASLIAKITFMD